VAVVVDANVLIVVATGDPRRTVAEAALRAMLAQREPLHAPALLPYEVASGLTRAVAGGVLQPDRVGDLWRSLAELPITLHPVADRVPQVVAIARRLERASAYDAAYIDLAEQLAAELWTFDGPLARNAVAAGFPVRLLGG
jgi:predicted nucleic acid-binding protein